MVTRDDVELMTIKQLTSLYNDFCQIANKTPIAKFKDKETGIKRVMELVELKARQDAEKPVTAIPSFVKVAGSVSGMIQQMIADGATNEEIWPAVQERFHLDDSKKTYVNWNRTMLKRKAAKDAVAAD